MSPTTGNSKQLKQHIYRERQRDMETRTVASLWRTKQTTSSSINTKKIKLRQLIIQINKTRSPFFVCHMAGLTTLIKIIS